MAVLPMHNYPSLLSAAEQNATVAVYEKNRRKQVVIFVLLVIVAFQAIDLLGSFLSHSMTDVWTALLGFALCGIALVFHKSGQMAVVSVLLIIVVDLGCGVMLLFSPMGLDVGSLPVFDVLLLSELIAVSPASRDQRLSSRVAQYSVHWRGHGLPASHAGDGNDADVQYGVYHRGPAHYVANRSRCGLLHLGTQCAQRDCSCRPRRRDRRSPAAGGGIAGAGNGAEA